jgi:RNA polymerase sigma-70 factor (sigma-E family)
MRPATERIQDRLRRKPVAASASAGDYEAFFRRVFPKAVGVAVRISGNRASAEDAALEALAKAHFRWRKIGDAPWREAWVMRVTVNEAIRHLPRPGLAPSSTFDAGAEPAQADPTDALVLRQTLGAALQSLPKRQREVIVLRYLVGLSEPEVAATLGLSLGTVKTHLRRGLTRLRTTVGASLKEEHLARLV